MTQSDDGLSHCYRSDVGVDIGVDAMDVVFVHDGERRWGVEADERIARAMSV